MTAKHLKDKKMITDANVLSKDNECHREGQHNMIKIPYI